MPETITTNHATPAPAQVSPLDATLERHGQQVPDDQDADDVEETAEQEQEKRPAPNWKDVPEGMAALYQEGCKQAPDQTLTMLCRVLRPATTVRTRRGTERRSTPQRIPLN